MKKIIIILISIFQLNNSYSQIHEISAGYGVAYYFGDLNTINNGHSLFNFANEVNFSQLMPSYSLGYRFNFNKRFSLGLGLQHMNVNGSDAKNTPSGTSDISYFRVLRNLSFTSAINQLYIDGRYEPFRNMTKWENGKLLFSPYAGVGIGMFNFNPKAFYNGIEYELQPLGTEGQGLTGNPAKYNLTQICFPTSLGLKVYSPKRMLSYGIEFVYTFTNTDYIDDVSTVYTSQASFTSQLPASQAAIAYGLSNRASDPANALPGAQRGDPVNNDYFLTGQFRLTYLFNSGGSGSSKDKFYRCCYF